MPYSTLYWVLAVSCAEPNGPVPDHCALRNGSFVSLQASLLKGIHLIQIAGHAGLETIFRVWPLLI